MPRYKEEFLSVVNKEGYTDRLLLLHIEESVDQIIRTSNESTWLRIGDKTVEMLGDNLRNLEYAKNARHFEDEINRDATIEDLDTELLSQYFERIGADQNQVEKTLNARGFIKKHDGKSYLTNAAVLLFAKNIYKFYPNCRIRFLRYEGTFAESGAKMNIIRDKSIEEPLLRIIEDTKAFIETQLREFTMLNVKTGRFHTVPEYPEFAWQEGIVNAVTHREYGLSGSYIKVSMYDDRLEIESPGKLPSIVTVSNIRETRYARNSRISRVLTDFGWVKELNEGVARIYKDMEAFFLDAPVYSEPGESVKLVLYNNIVMRTLRQKVHAAECIGPEIWDSLDSVEQVLLTYLVNHGAAKRQQLSDYTHRSSGTVINRLNHLMEVGLVKANGSLYDPNRTYEATIE
jgi:ATP-dependent DNA helicase RecG